MDTTSIVNTIKENTKAIDSTAKNQINQRAKQVQKIVLKIIKIILIKNIILIIIVI